MTIEELNQRKAELDVKYKEDLQSLFEQYALTNYPHEIGSVIEDHIGRGRILSLKVHYDSYEGKPVIIYRCNNLTRKGEINKREPIRLMYSQNLK